MASILQPVGYIGWGAPQPGYPGYIAPAPVVKPPIYVKTALVCHGEVDHHAFNHPFVVPTHVRVNFFYDPKSEESTVCYAPSDLPRICELAPKYIYPPGSTCPNLHLTRTDDIRVATGFYSCSSGIMVPATSLGPAEVHTPPLDYYSSYLDLVINDLEREQGASGEIYDVYVLACGATARYKMHPSRMTTLLLRNGSQIRQNLLEQAQATASAAQHYYQLTNDQKEDYLWKEIRRLQQGGNRKKRSTHRKRKGRGRSRRHR